MLNSLFKKYERRREGNQLCFADRPFWRLHHLAGRTCRRAEHGRWRALPHTHYAEDVLSCTTVHFFRKLPGLPLVHPKLSKPSFVSFTKYRILYEDLPSTSSTPFRWIPVSRVADSFHCLRHSAGFSIPPLTLLTFPERTKIQRIVKTERYAAALSFALY